LDIDFEVEGVSYLEGDEVIDILKYEPVEQGSCTFVKTYKRFMVFVEDVRKTHIRVKSVAGGGESRIRVTTRSRLGGPAGTERYVLRLKYWPPSCPLAPSLEPEVLEKVAADAVLRAIRRHSWGMALRLRSTLAWATGPRPPRGATARSAT
jgi:hypothetical protein